MRRIKVTFDLGGTWRIVTHIKVSKSISITKSKSEAINVAQTVMREQFPKLYAVIDVQNMYAEVVA